MTPTIQQFLIATTCCRPGLENNSHCAWELETGDLSTFSQLLVNLGQARSYTDYKSNQLKPSVALNITRDALPSKILANFTKIL